MKRPVYRTCPFCKDTIYYIEPWGKNLYYLSCARQNTVTGFWVEKNKYGRYSRVEVKQPKRLSMSAWEKKTFDSLQTPFWRLMGQRAKPSDIALEKELKRRGMNYGDYRLMRDAQAGASEQNAFNQYVSHRNTYGTKNAPETHLKKVN